MTPPIRTGSHTRATGGWSEPLTAPRNTDRTHEDQRAERERLCGMDPGDAVDGEFEAALARRDRFREMGE